MTSLAEKEGLKGKVQMIYIDPPYGIRFGSNWQISTRKHDVKDGNIDDVTRQPEQVRAFRDTWRIGIHSYLSYLRDRLVLCRELWGETGSIFVQIGDENVHLVRNTLDEVFGSENFVSLITFSKTTGTTGARIPGTADYILCYAKSIEQMKYRQPVPRKISGKCRWRVILDPVQLPRWLALRKGYRERKGTIHPSFQEKFVVSHWTISLLRE